MESRHLDSTVGNFHRQMTNVWHHRDQRDILRLYEFLSRLRPEFENVRAQLLTRRPRPSLSKAMPKLRTEETRL